MAILEATSTILLLLLAVFSAAAAFNAIWPTRRTALLIPSMLWSWFVIGMLGQHLIIQVALAAVLVWAGALDNPAGWVALGVLALSWIGAGYVIVATRNARSIVDEALQKAGIPRTSASVERWRTLLVFPLKGRSVHKTGNVPFRRVAGRTLNLDLYHNGSETQDRPILLYIHGGAWVVGDKREQGLPLIHHLARNGWLCVSANYRLSPGAGWPDHLVDVKAGLAWVKEHAREYGGDASFVAVAGGSAGGHLAAMMALTENDAAYQPGFEEADTSVQVAVPVYGIYDVTNRLGVQHPKFVPLLMEPIVMKAFLEDEPETFAAASPIDRIHAGAPPFVIPQGDKDTLSPVEETRAFVRELEAVSTRRVVYMEFPAAQHVFDIAYSYQSAQMIEGVLSVLEDEHRQYSSQGERR